MSAFSTAIQSALSTLKTVAGTAVTFNRGASSVSVTAVPGHSDFQEDNGDGTVVEFTAADWIVKASDLDFGSGPVLPQRNDVVKKVVGNTTQLYQVLSPPYRPSDADGARIRIHTKLTGTA